MIGATLSHYRITEKPGAVPPTCSEAISTCATSLITCRWLRDGLWHQCHPSSKGDKIPAARDFIEKYGVQIDPGLHEEVLARYAKLNLAPYTGFLNPELTPVIEDGRIVDVKIAYPVDYMQQMLMYGKRYSFL
jgi:hypothetical protein